MAEALSHSNLPPSTKQTAIVANKSGDLIVSQNVGLPELSPGMLLVKTIAVAINPADVKLTGPMATEGATAGSDGAGIVVSIGPPRDGAAAPGPGPNSRFKIGDRICAPHTSMDPLAPRHGAFAEYVTTAADFTLKIPDGMSFESGATLGIVVGTIGHALFYSLKIPGHPERPASAPAVVLIHGGSTASGTMAIQLVRRFGNIPITTCSPSNFPLVERYGAEKTFDYHDPDACATQIKEYTHNSLEYALDCVCDPAGDSMALCYAAIGRAGGKYTSLQPFAQHVAETRKRRVKPDWILGSALFGKKINWKPPYDLDGDAKLRKFGEEWFLCAQRLLDNGGITPHPGRVSRVRDGGGGVKTAFEGVLEGIGILERREVSGEKLVYRIADP